MNPQYYVRTAPRHPEPRFAFSAFSIRPAQAELFDVAHVILLAEAVTASGATIAAEGDPAVAPSSHRALVLIRRIMQQETALPVVRRLVEALREANTVLYHEQAGARIIAGVLIKNTLYLTCVGAMSAYVIRQEKVATLLQAERTRASYLGRSLQLQLDYQVPTAAALFAEAQTPHAYVIADRYLLAPGDSVVFCSTELSLALLKSALIYTRQPERLATYLAQNTLRQVGKTPGVIALHWHVNRVAQTVKQLLLVFFIFFCVTAAMQSVVFINQRLDQWLTLQRGDNPTRPLPPLFYDAAAATAPNAHDPAATPGARTSVQVNVDVNVQGAAPLVNQAEAARPVAALVPIVAADILTLAPAPTAIQLASASIEQVADEPLPVLASTTASHLPIAQEQSRILVEQSLDTAADLPASVAAGALAPTATPTVSPLARLPIVATTTHTALPTAIPLATPSLVPAAAQATNTPLPPTAPVTTAATPTDSATPTVDTVRVSASALADAVLIANETVTLLAPPEQTSSRDLLTFAWQGATSLPAGQAYEVIVWQPGQVPMTDGLGIAPPGQAQNLPIQLRGLQDAGIIRPGTYHWGVLRVTVDPYTRLALLSPERTFYFDGPDQAPKCNPDRETC